MAILDLKQTIIKKKVKAGTVLVLQGNNNKGFNVLHSGMAEILSYPGDAGKASAEEIIEGSLRVGLIKSESLFGVMGIVSSDTEYSKSIRAVTDCIVSCKPIKQEEILPTLQRNMNFNLQILRAMVKRIESSIFLFNNYKYLWHKFASIADSLALCGDFFSGLDRIESATREDSSIEEYAAFLKQTAAAKDIALPEMWDNNIFLGRVQTDLDLYRDHDDIKVESIIDQPQFLFLKRLLRKKNNVLTALFSKDEPTNSYILKFLGETLLILKNNNEQLAGEIDSLMKMIYGKDGWILKILNSQDIESQEIAAFLHYLTKFSWRCRKDAMNLLGKDMHHDYPVYSELKRFRALSANTADSAQIENTAKEHQRGQNVLLKYKGLLNKILKFATMPPDFNMEFREQINLFKDKTNKLATDAETSAIRTRLTEMYWQLYEVCFLKIIDSDLKGFIPGIMLHAGVIDETLLTEAELTAVDRLYTGLLYTDETIPVMTLPYFLEKIYRSELNPSMSEMGELFHKVIKGQEKLSPRQREGVYLFQDTAEDRVRYEIRQILGEVSKVLSGSKKKALPFLFSEAFMGSADRLCLHPEELAGIVEKFKSRDFSAFYREVLLKNKLSTEIIKQEICPYFVLFPTAGSRTLLWQEVDGTRKNTPGRIFLPLFYSEKIDDAVLALMASFRWELQKTIAGVKWTDPVEGGVVGAYYDYIGFYKKNPSLSTTAKEKLHEFVKKTRSDKDRFSQDYIAWLNFEYEGKIKLNQVARDIFYRYCPFPADIRKEMAKKPLYADLENKYQNRKHKELLKMETKKRKFEKAGKPIPLELQDYIDFIDF
jgi:CRP-like cAMP-binding protein